MPRAILRAGLIPTLAYNIRFEHWVVAEREGQTASGQYAGRENGAL